MFSNTADYSVTEANLSLVYKETPYGVFVKLTL